MTASTKNLAETMEPEVRVSSVWGTRGKITAVIIGIAGILVLMGLALANFGQEKTMAPAPSKDDRAPSIERATVPVTMVTATDFTSCKSVRSVKLDNGNIRVIGSDCAPVVEPPAQAEKPALAVRVRRSAAILPPATKEELTNDQLETAAVVETVTEEILEELRPATDAPPEGAIDVADLDMADPATPSAE